MRSGRSPCRLKNLIRHCASTDIGRVRKRNEDAFLVDEELGLYAVADGMGGHQAGDVASRLALDVFRDSLAAAESRTDPPALLRTAVSEANDRVFEESILRGHMQGMGTTLTGLWFPEGTDLAWLAHVGDSRCYRQTPDGLEQLSHDHSWVQTQIDEGHMSAEDAFRHPMRNVITRSIGFEPELETDVREIAVSADDVFLRGSDGLTGKIRDHELEEYLRRPADAADYAEVLDELIAVAKERGGEDNITVVIVWPGANGG
jgi:protein phosphatase